MRIEGRKCISLMMLLHLSPPSEVISCGHFSMAEVIPELMMGRSRAGHLNFASLGISLQLSDCESVAEGGGKLEEKTGGIDDGWREIPVRRAWSDGRDGDYLDGFHTFPGMCTKFDGLRPSSKRVLLLLLWSLDRVPGSP